MNSTNFRVKNSAKKYNCNIYLELYRLIGEGHKAMQEGRIRTIDEVKEKLEKRKEGDILK